MCNCSEAGSLNNDPECLPDTGVCQCKEYVDGINCDRSVDTRVQLVIIMSLNAGKSCCIRTGPRHDKSCTNNVVTFNRCQSTSAENLVKFVGLRVAPKIHADRQTDRHTHYNTVIS